MPPHPEVLLAMSDSTCRVLFNRARIRRLADLASLHEPLHMADLDSSAARARLASVEVLVTGWGCPLVTEQVRRWPPALRAVLHAGGTVVRGVPLRYRVHAHELPYIA